MPEHSAPALFDELTRCRPWIEAALEYTHGAHVWDDIVAGVYAGHFHLFAKPRGCVVLEIRQYPRKREMNVFLAGGELEEILNNISELDAIAHRAGAEALTMGGRPGWGPVLSKNGWHKMPEVTMRREVCPETMAAHRS
ncbi:hypothetical protein PXK01_19580 [Phaeobacter sp. PT47_59]|uniref:hypothetical protein n=1 Tax=Phaeobacter sp. PT47_59 TaxID=3029979 RepID=UPI002380B4FE|nr:hypothetical protein [Phaeobacter sp. PT47_59]MDE4176363.1 hypothetical protein [Phaeobacter sp. PT47_59]